MIFLKILGFYLCYVNDTPRSDRPKKCISEIEEQVIKAISKNSTTREWSTQVIANTLSPLIRGGISACSIYQILCVKATSLAN